jgi:hypothetical protein
MNFIDLFKKLTDMPPTVSVASRLVINHSMVQPDNTPLLQKRGWSVKGNTYRGYYRTRFGAWAGTIVRQGDIFKVLIENPPMEQIKKHTRNACFHHEKNGTWRINLAVNPKDQDVSAIIYYVEKVINESFML